MRETCDQQGQDREGQRRGPRSADVMGRSATNEFTCGATREACQLPLSATRNSEERAYNNNNNNNNNKRKQRRIE